MKIKNLVLSFTLAQLLYSQTYFLQASYYAPPTHDEELIENYNINNRLETANLIQKSRLDGDIKITNDSAYSQEVACKLGKKEDKPNSDFTIKFETPAHVHSTMIVPEGTILKSLDYSSKESLKVEVNTQAKKAEISVSDKSVLAFPRPLTPFDFKARFIHNPHVPYLQEYYDASRPIKTPDMTHKDQEDYDGNLRFCIETMCPGEGINPRDFFQKRQDLDSKNNLNESFFKAKISQIKPQYKIPQLIHRIWLTPANSPREIPLEYIEWAKASVNPNPLSEGWRHIFWVQDKSKLPETMKRLDETSIEVREISALNTTINRSRYLDQSINDRKFGKGSDILRYIILKEFGGIYADTDYRLDQSCNVLNKIYDCYVGLEPMSNFLGNAFIAVRPNHPVMNRVLELIDRNLDATQAPDYIRLIPENDGFKTILITGPAALTVAFAQSAGQGENRDIALQPMILYPTPNDSYPQKKVASSEGPISLTSLGAHFWRTAWVNPDLGSQG